MEKEKKNHSHFLFPCVKHGLRVINFTNINFTKEIVYIK